MDDSCLTRVRFARYLRRLLLMCRVELLFEHFTYLLTVDPIYMAVFVSPVFRVYDIMHNAHSDLQNTNAFFDRQRGRKPMGFFFV